MVRAGGPGDGRCLLELGAGRRGHGHPVPHGGALDTQAQAPHGADAVSVRSPGDIEHTEPRRDAVARGATGRSLQSRTAERILSRVDRESRKHTPARSQKSVGHRAAV